MYLYNDCLCFIKIMGSLGNVWAIYRVKHVCNIDTYKSLISGLFKISKRSQRDDILLYLGTHFNTIYYTSEFRFWGVFLSLSFIFS